MRDLISRIVARLAAPRKPGPSDYGRPIASLTAGNALVEQLVRGDRPAMVGRMGGVELAAVAHYLRFRPAWRYPRSVVDLLRNNAGVFGLDAPGSLDDFARVYLDAATQLDAMGIWHYGFEDIVAREHSPRAALILPRSIEPYYHDSPWSRALEGRRVLVIHPFAESIRRNYERRSALFSDPHVLPSFELLVMRPVQSLAGARSDFPDWIAALDSMKREMERIDFEVGLIGAGAYGFPLAAHAKRLGKKAIHVGGALQILFGIKGRRWDDHPLISKLYNEAWTRPLPSETPDRAKSVEGGCYW